MRYTYRVAIQKGSRNSDQIRRFNHYIASGEIERSSQDSYYRMLFDSNLNQKECGLHEVKAFHTTVYGVLDSYGRKLTPCAPFDAKYLNYEYHFGYTQGWSFDIVGLFLIFTPQGSYLRINPGTKDQVTYSINGAQVHHYPNGRVESLSLNGQKSLDGGANWIQIGAAFYKCSARPIEFLENGNVRLCTLAESTVIQYQGRPVSFTGGNYHLPVYTDGYGKVGVFFSEKPIKLKISGTHREVLVRGQISVDDSFHVTWGELVHPIKVLAYEAASPTVIEVDTLKGAQDGKIYLYEQDADFKDFKFNGLRVVFDSGGTGYAARQACAKIGFIFKEGRVEVAGAETETKYFSGRGMFFSANTLKPEERQDETLTTIKNLGCAGSFWAKLL